MDDRLGRVDRQSCIIQLGEDGCEMEGKSVFRSEKEKTWKPKKTVTEEMINDERFCTSCSFFGEQKNNLKMYGEWRRVSGLKLRHVVLLCFALLHRVLSIRARNWMLFWGTVISCIEISKKRNIKHEIHRGKRQWKTRYV